MDFNHLVLFPADAYLVESFTPQIIGDLRPELVCRLVRHWLARMLDLGIDLKKGSSPSHVGYSRVQVGPPWPRVVPRGAIPEREWLPPSGAPSGSRSVVQRGPLPPPFFSALFGHR